MLRSLLLAAAFAAVSCARAPERPNLVLLLTDDQRYDTLGCTGNPFTSTPNLDRLAREGALFERAYVATSLCCPARASILTGKYPQLHGITGNNSRVGFLENHAGFPELLQKAGYETAFVGKWHIQNRGARPRTGFDHWVSFEGQGSYRDQTVTVNDTAGVELAGFAPDRLTELAVEWLDDRGSAPFLLVLSLKNCHRPYRPADRHLGALDHVDFAVAPVEAEGARPRYALDARRHVRNQYAGGVFEVDPSPAVSYRRYLELVLSVDDCAGELLAALERNGELDDTLVAMTSDGGFLWGEHGLWRKRLAYEPSIHVPLLMRFPPEIPAGTRIDELALNVDLASTFLDLAGVAVPEDYQGMSLRGLWGGVTAGWRESFLYLGPWEADEDGPLALAVGERGAKYIRYRDQKVEEILFDLERDPEERTNVARDPAYAGELERLRAELEELMESHGAPSRWRFKRS